MRYIVTIDASHPDIAVSLLASLENELRSAARDPQLTITRIERGSVRLCVESTESGYLRILILFSAGRLSTLGPHTIITVSPLETGAASAPESGEPKITSIRLDHVQNRTHAIDPSEPADVSRDRRAHPYARHAAQIRHIVNLIAPTEARLFDLMWSDYIDEPHRPLNDVGPIMHEVAFGSSHRSPVLSTFLIPLVAAVVSGEVQVTEDDIRRSLHRILGRDTAHLSASKLDEIVDVLLRSALSIKRG